MVKPSDNVNARLRRRPDPVSLAAHQRPRLPLAKTAQLEGADVDTHEAKHLSALCSQHVDQCWNGTLIFHDLSF